MAEDQEQLSENKPYLMQRVDSIGNIIESRAITENEFQRLQSARAGSHSQSKYVSGCNIKVYIFYEVYYDHNAYYFSPTTITYVFEPNTEDMWHFNIVRQPSICSGTLMNDKGKGTYTFYPAL